MVTRTSPFRLPFPRRVLIRIHEDLFRIAKYAGGYAYPRRLLIVEKMVLISEDRRFFRHNGIDYRSCLREAIRAATFRRFGGASTIDMQFVRTATGYYESSLRRKLYEMLLAWLLQFRYTKIQILRSYLRRAYFGTGVRGIEAASWRLYSKRPENLDLNEASVIAAMLVHPIPRVQTSTWQRKVTRRSNYLVSLYPTLEQRFEKLPSWESV
jgi:membrane peptidoglycan carboxypeptidase